MANNRPGRKRIKFNNNRQAMHLFRLCSEGVISKRQVAKLLNVSVMTVCRRMKEYEKYCL